MPEVLAGLESRPFTVRADGMTIDDPTAALVSNNPYAADDPAGLGRRPRLDTGRLGLICVRVEPPPPPPELVRRLRVHPPVVVTTAATIVVDGAQPTITAAIDGESVTLDLPVSCTLLPRALRVRVPRDRRHRYGVRRMSEAHDRPGA